MLMVDQDILWAKISAMEKHLGRIMVKKETSLHDFLEDLDRQESILFNLQMAIQNCIDMAAHIVSEEGLGVAGSTSELFYLLEDHGIIERELTEKMVRAMGFRNLVVHEYGKVDLEIVFRASHDDVNDLREFVKALSGRFG